RAREREHLPALRRSASAGPRVDELAGEPAAELDLAHAASAISPQRERPVAGRSVIERPRARQQPDIGTVRLQDLHAPLPEKAREAAIEHAAGIYDAKLGIKLAAMIAAGEVDGGGAGARLQPRALVLVRTIHPKPAALVLPQPHGSAFRAAVAFQLKEIG